MTVSVRCMALVFLSAILPSLASAQQARATKPADRAKFAVTKLADVDRDFAYQGEYLGATKRASWGYEYFGLHVVALGDGAFDGVLLPGGVPGAGWNRRDRWTLTGRNTDGRVTLDSDRYSVRLQSHRATVQDKQTGETVSLQKLNRISFTQGLKPPHDATVLFDGSSTEAFENGKMNDEGLLEVGPLTRMPVKDFRLHLEFRTPYMPYARGQGRGNSGVYIQQRYEVQILDSFGLEGVENECGGLYKQQRPAVNMCLPPLAWQTYDIYFTAARFHEDGSKRVPARLTVLHNGELIHTVYELKGKTGAGQAESTEARPILFQNHSDPVHFRNVWIVPGVPKSDLRIPGYSASTSSVKLSQQPLRFGPESRLLARSR